MESASITDIQPPTVTDMKKAFMILRKMACVLFWVLFPAVAGCSDEPTESAVAPMLYSGMSDASAAVALDERLFLAADDERNTLKVYRCDRGGPAVHAIAWDEPLGIDLLNDTHPEVDIEGGTVLGDRIFWISSHGRNKEGVWRANRHRFFAMTVTVTNEGVKAEPFGKAYDNLAVDLANDLRLQDLGWLKALGLGDLQAPKLAPKRDGLNIEGLCATRDGKSLLIACRNPTPDKKALLVPLLNPAAVLEDQAAPEFGDPILLKLRVKKKKKKKAIQLGIRSIEYSPQHASYLILGGPHDKRRVFGLFKWSGDPDDKPQLLEQSTEQINQIEDFAPEALIVYPDRKEIQLLSDDGALMVKVESEDECQEDSFQNGFCQAKFLRDETRRTFKSITLDLDLSADIPVGQGSP